MIGSSVAPGAHRSSPFAERSPRPHFLCAARQLILGAVATLALVVLPLALHSSPTVDHVVVVESASAAGRIDRQRVIRIVEQVCSELRIAESAIPELVFIHLDADEARSSGVPAGKTVMVERTSVTLESRGDALPARFLVWIVGRVDDKMIVAAVTHVVRLHLQLGLSDQDLLLAQKRVLQRLNATIDVSSFVKQR